MLPWNYKEKIKQQERERRVKPRRTLSKELTQQEQQDEAIANLVVEESAINPADLRIGQEWSTMKEAKDAAIVYLLDRDESYKTVKSELGWFVLECKAEECDFHLCIIVSKKG